MRSLMEKPEAVALLVQRVADGAASEGDLREFSAWAAVDPALGSAVGELQAQSLALKSYLLAQGDAVDFGRMRARVLQECMEDPPRAQGGVAMWARVKAAWHHPGVWAPVGAVAMAAALALVIPHLGDFSGAPPEAASTVAAAEIHSLDADGSTAVVFQSPGSSVTVIWLTRAEDTDDDDGDDNLDGELPKDVPSEVEAELSHEPTTASP